MKLKNIKTWLLLASLLLTVLLLAVACESGTEGNTGSESESENTCEHANIEYVVAKAATCTEKGSANKVCSDCDAVLETVESPTTAHVEEIIKGKSATCLEDGLTDGKKCSVCDAELVAQTPISKLGHTERAIAGVAATCTAEGKTVGKDCSVCGKVIVEQTTVPMLEHTETIVDGIAPTCTSEGKSAGKACSVCGTVLVEQSSIAKLEHTERIIDGIAPTCLEEGKSAGKDCSVCGEIILEQATLPPTGHTESDWIVDNVAQIGVEGNKHTECLSCGIEIQSETIPALTEDHVHAGSSWIVSTQPTCTANGVKTLICECGMEMDTAPVDMIAHTEETIPSIAAKCNATGLTEGKKCSVCGTVTVEQTVTAMLPHTEEIIPAITAKCNATGLSEGRKCSVCGTVTVEQTATAKLPHTEETIPGIAAKCNATGLTDGKKCSVCGEITVAQQTIAKISHTEETVLGTAPTCTEYGASDGKKCSVCGETTLAQIPVPPTGHSFSAGACTNCGVSNTYGVWIVDGLGNPVKNVIVKVMREGEQVALYPYNGTYITFDLDLGTYQLELDLSQTGKTYVYDTSLLTLTPNNRHASIRLFENPSPRKVTDVEVDGIYVSAPIDGSYAPYDLTAAGSYRLTLTANDYTFIVFKPTKAAIYTLTYECDEELKISYHGTSFFVQGSDLSEDSTDIGAYENGLYANFYASNIGGDLVFAIKSEGATTCILNISNAGDPGTRLSEQPWTPYLEDESKVAEQLAAPKEGTYTVIDVTDTTLTAVFNENDGYYHLGSANGPVIFIDLSTNSRFVAAITTICANQRMGAYIYDINGNVSEKRSYNELFIQYGMPSDGSAVDEPIRVPLTAKLAEAIQSFGERNNWWTENSESNIFDPVLLGAPYNREYAWLLYCGYYASNQ